MRNTTKEILFLSLEIALKEILTLGTVGKGVNDNWVSTVLRSVLKDFTQALSRCVNLIPV